MNSSNPQNDNSGSEYKAFLNTLTKEVICPYCGNPNQLDPPILCCGEVHAEEVYSDGEETFTENCLEKMFQKWLASNEAAIATGAKYE